MKKVGQTTENLYPSEVTLLNRSGGSLNPTVLYTFLETFWKPLGKFYRAATRSSIDFPTAALPGLYSAFPNLRTLST